MKRWQAMILYIVIAAVSFQGFRMLLGLWTIEVYKQGVIAGFTACPKQQDHQTMLTYDTIMPSGASKVTYLEIAKTRYRD